MTEEHKQQWLLDTCGLICPFVINYFDKLVPFRMILALTKGVKGQQSGHYNTTKVQMLHMRQYLIVSKPTFYVEYSYQRLTRADSIHLSIDATLFYLNCHSFVYADKRTLISLLRVGLLEAIFVSLFKHLQTLSASFGKRDLRFM